MSSNAHPSFFKVVIAIDFTKLLRLPPAVTRKCDLTENVKLISLSGRRWKVKMERMANGQICFTKGWKFFAEETALRLGEFIVFSELATAEFVVEIYGTDFCRRQIPPPTGENDVELFTRERSPSKNGNPLYFEIRLKQHQQSRISLPKRFSDAAGLNKKREVKAEFEGGNHHSQMILAEPRPKRNVDLTKGWTHFRESNRLAYDKNYSFEFVMSQNTIHVKEVPSLASSSLKEAIETEDQAPSFMMFGLQECRNEFCIPVKFVAKYEQVKKEEMVILRTDSGKSWEMKVKKDKNENYYMRDGWPEFMEDNEIVDMDFLVFRLVGKATFKVMIYRDDGCLKEPITSPTISENGVDEDENVSERRRRRRPEKKGGSDDPIYFEKPLMLHHKSRLTLPTEFSRAAKMEEKALVRMEFVPTHHSVSVAVDPRPQKYRFDLIKGWPEFRVANKLGYGKIYSFEFNPEENVIYVKEVMKEAYH